ncbi:MAG TPA: alpha/beta hydrolase [Gemmatimonadales bacterium]|nr:alpha/beta hydrolase [Gemmatimonadales bacterium]
MTLALLGLLTLGVLMFITYIGDAYRTQIGRARKRVATGGQMLETARSQIEYAERGEGPSVLVIHGAGGGCDQGLDLAESLVQRGFRAIAVSRFGYLRTPLPQDASPAAQADAHAAVLDALEIPRCAVLGASAGGPSAVQLALRHPDRVTALVLMVPALYAPRPTELTSPQRMSALGRVLMDLTLRSDFLFWLALRLAPKAMTRMILGTPPALLTHADPLERERLHVVMEHILPVSERRLGLINDGAVIPALTRFDLERVEAPTLIISAQDCLYQTFAGSQYSAEHIPGARFIGYQSGGHLLVGHQQEITAEVVTFLRAAQEARTVRAVRAVEAVGAVGRSGGRAVRRSGGQEHDGLGTLLRDGLIQSPSQTTRPIT